MNIMTSIIIATSISGIIGTGAGGCLGALIKNKSSIITSIMLSFAGGVMISVVCLDLISNALTIKDSGVLLVSTCILIGFLSIQLISNRINTKKKNLNNMLTAGIVMACAIAIHNLPEGIVIGASYASDTIISTDNTGITMAVVIGLHNIPEGMAVAVPLISGGMNRLKAISITALSGLPTVIGAIIGYGMGMINNISLIFSMCFAAGAMLYVVLGELLPESIILKKSNLTSMAAVLGIILGILIVYM